MGSLTQKLKEITGQTEDEKVIKERLELLLLAAKAKLRAYRDEVDEAFMNPGQVDKIQIPGIRAIRYIEQYHVAARDQMNTQVSDHLDRAVDAFFSIGGKDQDTKKAIQGGVKELISVGLDAFIGSTEAGETEEKMYIVIPENNAFVRVDIACWKYHMVSTKVVESSDTAVAYLLCKSVIDHTKIDLDELIYLVSESLSQNNAASALPTITKDFYVKKEDGSVTETKPSSITANPTDSTFAEQLKSSGHYKVTRTLLAQKDADGNLVAMTKVSANNNDASSNYIEAWSRNSGGNPPPITAVEAYIEELIRVWNKLKTARE